MNHIESQNEKKEYKVVSSIKVVEEEIEIQRPTFVDIDVQRPVFVDKQIEVPQGFEEFAKKAGTMIADTALTHIISSLERKLDEAIKDRLDSIKAPKIIEEVKVVTREVEVEKPVYKEVEIDRPKYREVEVTNTKVREVDVTNAKITNVDVINAVLKDKEVVNPVFRDISIDRPVYVDKEITVIHPKYIDLQGRGVNDVS